MTNMPYEQRLVFLDMSLNGRRYNRFDPWVREELHRRIRRKIWGLRLPSKPSRG
jgi:hypothetical protein